MASLKPALDPERSLGYQVRRCHRKFDRLLNVYLSDYGFGSGFWYYLRVLWQRDRLTQKALSDDINVAENSTTVTIAAMSRRGLVTRLRDVKDRRKVMITLTDEARALEQKLIPLAIQINSIALEGVTPAELETCLSVLRRAAENLERERKSGVGLTDPRSAAPGKTDFPTG